MIRLGIRSLLEHKLRLAMTSFAVVLGVSFVVGSMVVTDTVRGSFETIFAEVNGGIDLQVRSESAFGFDAEESDHEPLPASVLDDVAAVDGVARAEGVVEGTAQPIDADGDAVTTTGAPLLGFSWVDDPGLSPVDLSTGDAPGPGEIVVDQATFDDHAFALGDDVDVLVPTGNETFTLVGTVTFGESNSLAGARLTMFEPTDAQRVFDRVGQWDTVDVALADGADAATVRADVTGVVPAGVEVITGDELTDEASQTVGEFVDVFGNILLGFAAVALFVSAFSIHNTFSIILGQRVRELALLRAIGASARQIRRSVIVESLLIGVVSSVIGIGTGMLTALGLRALLNAGGMGLPADSLALEPATIVAAFVVGVGVTLLSSILPARTAAKVAPVAGLRDGVAPAPRSSRIRLAVGGVVTAVGGALFAFGLLAAEGTAQTLTGLAGGAMLLFLGVANLAPLFAGPVSRVLGAPVARAFGLPGVIARENAARNPARTASTASALVIGLALVTTVTVVGTSAKETFTAATDRAVSADFIISEPSFNGFSPQLAASLDDAPELDAVSAIRFGEFQFEGSRRDIVAVGPGGGDVVDVDLLDGDPIAELGPDEIMLFEDPARDLGVGPGDAVEVSFGRTGDQTMTVAGVYGDATFAGNYLISTEAWDANFSASLDSFVFAQAADGASIADAAAAVDAATADYPQVDVEDRQEFLASQEAQLDQVLVTVNVLLLLAVVIAVLGIANTLALSVFERTRELGLLRAVGMSRRQTRRMVRWEAAIVALFGAVLGVAMGVGFGSAIASAVPPSAIDTVAVPTGTLLALVGIAVVAGLLAAIMPARRAGRLDVLDAIAAT